MQTTENIDDSRQYLRLALEHIGKHGLSANPLNYSIWYEYASGKNEALNAAIDNYLEGMDTFTEGVSQKFFNEFFVGNKEAMNKIVSEGLKKVFGEIAESIKTTSLQYSDSDKQLETINRSLASTFSETEAEMTISKIKQTIANLESTNSSFKAQLDQSTNEIDQLKNKLERYRTEAIKDPLTRIANRRGFDKKLKDAVDNANTDGTSLCLIMADIDHFKKVNDTHGHLVGDNVIRMVASTIKETVKGKDLAARIGGEEFAIVLPDTPYDGAMKLANDIRLSFEGLDLKKKSTGESLGRITLSLGVTKYKNKEVAEFFVDRADKALYNSKNSGRNKVTGI